MKFFWLIVNLKFKKRPRSKSQPWKDKNTQFICHWYKHRWELIFRPAFNRRPEGGKADPLLWQQVTAADTFLQLQRDSESWQSFWSIRLPLWCHQSASQRAEIISGGAWADLRAGLSLLMCLRCHSHAALWWLITSIDSHWECFCSLYSVMSSPAVSIWTSLLVTFKRLRLKVPGEKQ